MWPVCLHACVGLSCLSAYSGQALPLQVATHVSTAIAHITPGCVQVYDTLFAAGVVPDEELY